VTSSPEAATNWPNAHAVTACHNRGAVPRQYPRLPVLLVFLPEATDALRQAEQFSSATAATPPQHHPRLLKPMVSWTLILSGLIVLADKAITAPTTTSLLRTGRNSSPCRRKPTVHMPSSRAGRSAQTSLLPWRVGQLAKAIHVFKPRDRRMKKAQWLVAVAQQPGVLRAEVGGGERGVFAAVRLTLSLIARRGVEFLQASVLVTPTAPSRRCRTGAVLSKDLLDERRRYR